MTTFEGFYAAERDRLVRVLAVDLADVDLAADAVDTAMARAWQRWSQIDDRHDAGAWVYRVARNWATSWFRQRRWRADGDVPEVPVRDHPPSHSTHIRAALDDLPADQRAVVVLRVLGGFSTAEVAAALEVPEGTVKSRLSRALDRLRPELEAQR